MVKVAMGAARPTEDMFAAPGTFESPDTSETPAPTDMPNPELP